MREDLKKQIEKLRDGIRHHDYCYYVLNQPEISDKEYDGLMARLKELEEAHPALVAPDSPTQRVGGEASGEFKTVRHKVKMLSLDNTYSFKELKEWAERVHKGLHHSEEVEYAVELKIDGVSVSLAYIDGMLAVGATRGDGEKGEDVTSNLRTIPSIPLKLLPFAGAPLPLTLEVRGEVYTARKDFEQLNKERAVFNKNPRGMRMADETYIAVLHKQECVFSRMEFKYIFKVFRAVQASVHKSEVIAFVPA